MTMPTTPFNVPRGSFPTPIAPIGVGPLEPPLVLASFNYQWCAVIMGCLQQLLLNTTWDVQTQAELTAIQENVFDLMAQFCVDPPPAAAFSQTGTDGNEVFMIRQNPTTPCLLESSVDGITWCTWADISKCQPSVTQPGNNPSQPGPTQCQDFHVVLPASGMWLLPIPVNTGDTLTVTNAKGAWNDGNLADGWQCPDGNQFILGLCDGLSKVVSGDPATGVPHMSLIGNINNSVYFGVLAGPVTIPSGVAFGSLWFQANDASIGGDLGSIEFDVHYCNNQTTPSGPTISLSGYHDPYACAGPFPTFSKTTVGVGDTFTVTQSAASPDGLYGMCWNASANAVFEVMNTTGWTVGSNPDWAWNGHAAQNDFPPPGATSPSCNGWSANSTTPFTVTFRVNSIP